MRKRHNRCLDGKPRPRRVGVGDLGVKRSNPSPGPSWSMIEAKAGNPRPKIGPETPKWDRWVQLAQQEGCWGNGEEGPVWGEQPQSPFSAQTVIILEPSFYLSCTPTWPIPAKALHVSQWDVCDIISLLRRWLHPQKCLVPFSAPEPYLTTVLAIPALASICALLCRTRCPTLQRCPWGPGTMTCLESPWQLELKKFPTYAIYRSCCVQEDIGMNVSTDNQAQGSLESLLVT